MTSALHQSSLSPHHRNRAKQFLDALSLEERVGKVFLFTLRNLPHAQMLLQYRPGGFIRLYSDAGTCAKQHEILQRESPDPLLIAADFERGVAPVVLGATEFAPAMALAAAGDPRLTFDVACAIANEARAVGVNFNLMPTADVNTDPRNPIINTRAFSDDPQVVATHVEAFVRGTQAGGCLTCAKHFPGHGATWQDSHAELPEVPISREEFQNVHFLPFRTAVNAGVDAIMIGHLSCPALDQAGKPATFSSRIIQGCLRDELGFEGLVVSDALDMGALSSRYSLEEIVVQTFLAGCDLLVMPADPVRAHEALLRAVLKGQVSEERVNEAAEHVLGLAIKASEERENVGNLEEFSHQAHTALAREAARQSITVVSEREKLLPLAHSSKIFVATLCNAPEGLFEYLDPKIFADCCQLLSPKNVSVMHCGYLQEKRYDRQNIAEQAAVFAANADIVVVGVFARIVLASGRICLCDSELAFVSTLLRGKKSVLVVFGSPYLLPELPQASVNICAYGSSPALQQVAAEFLFGRVSCTGRLPIRLPASG